MPTVALKGNNRMLRVTVMLMMPSLSETMTLMLGMVMARLWYWLC